MAPVTTSAAPAPPLPPSERHVSPLEQVLEGIRVVSPTERIATKHAVEVFLAHKTLLLGTVNAEPITKDGKTVAVRLFGISPNTVPSAVGFENGDQLVSLNGKPLFDDDMARMLGRLDEAFRSNEIEFDIIRKGVPTKLLVHVDTAAAH